MRITTRQTVAGLLGLGLAGLVLWAFVYHALLVGRVAKYRGQLLAKGERLSLKEAIPLPLPPERNSASYVRDAMALFNTQKVFLDNMQPPAMRLVAPGKAMIGWAQPEVMGDKTNSWEQVEAELRMYQPILSQLPRLIECPGMNFNLDYAEGPTLLLPHLGNFKKTAQLISAAALSDLHSGDTPTAATEVRGIVALSKGLRDEPLIISQLVRIAVAQIAMMNTWELLQSTNLTETQLAGLQQEWESLDFERPAEAALVMERASMGNTIAQMRRSSAGFRNILGMTGSGGSGSGNWLEGLGNSTAAKVSEAMWRFSWSYTDELRALQGQQLLLDTMRQAAQQGSFKEALERQRSGLRELGIRGDDPENEHSGQPYFELASLWSQSVASLRRFSGRVLAAEAARQLAITATALKRYNLHHGGYPSDLASLVPEFLPAVPRDPVDGQPLRYRVDPGAGFWLYSIGEDGQDDHGNGLPGPKTDQKTLGWAKGLDWVWPQPATVAEIADSYEKIPKWRKR